MLHVTHTRVSCRFQNLFNKDDSKKVSKEEKTQQKVGPLPSPVFSDSLYLVLLAYGAAEDGNWLDHAGKNQARK